MTEPNATPGAMPIPEDLREQFVLIGTGEGASATVVTDLREGLHSFMCFCGSALPKCGHEDTLQMLKEMESDDNWSFDEEGKRFQYSFDGYNYGITITRFTRPLPMSVASLESRLHSTNESLGAEIARGRSMTERISELESALSDSDCCKKVRSITHSKLEAENRHLRDLAACCYQFVGCRGMDEKWLNALSSASQGKPFSTDDLLPCSRLEGETAMPSEPSQAESLLAIENRDLREKLAVMETLLKEVLPSEYDPLIEHTVDSGTFDPEVQAARKGGTIGDWMRRAKAAEAKLETARADALEDAAKVFDARADQYQLQPSNRMVADMIRAVASPTGQK